MCFRRVFTTLNEGFAYAGITHEIPKKRRRLGLILNTARQENSGFTRLYRCGVELIESGFLVELIYISQDVSSVIHDSNYINGQFVEFPHYNTI
jgi:hypothetical protein